MPGLSGLQLTSVLQYKPSIIFLTAYQDYAVEAFNVGAIDYLLKPVSFERFLQAAVKALNFHRMSLNQFENFEKTITEDPEPLIPIVKEGQSTENSNFIYVYVEYSLVKIDTRNILYIEGLKDYVKIILSSTGKPVITRISMKLLEERLTPFGFLRTHRSYIVAIDCITSVQKSLISIGDTTLPVGENYRENLMKVINQKNILNTL
jgi:two-component system, LytTR family, response regulator